LDKECGKKRQNEIFPYPSQTSPKNFDFLGLSETLIKYEEEHNKCTSWHITVFLTLDRQRTKEKDIEKVQVLLHNIMNNCSTGQNMFVFFI
jgi:hypothetical protein